MLKFGEYLPDVTPLENPGLLDCQNILPRTAGYAPVPSAVVQSSNTIDLIPQGAFSCRNTQSADGAIYTFVGTADKLYSYGPTSFTDVSILGGYNVAADDTWEFVQWNNTVIATNIGDPIQAITLGSPPFANLAGSPPQARHIAVVDNFVVVGNTWDAVDLFVPHRVRWSGIGDPTTWAVSATTQADFQDLDAEDGYIQKVVGGEFGVIFQERAITRMSYIGSPLIWQFDKLESQRGALAANSVIKVGDRIAYLAQDGFFAFNGEQSLPIGDAKIDQTFFDTVDISNLVRMSVALYPSENIICWSYVSLEATGLICDTILFYNYSPNSQQRWSYAKIDNYMILTPISQAYTLDGLDAVSTNLDTGIIYSLDSKVWQGSLNLLATITSDLHLAIVNGPPLDATIETGEAWLQEPRRTFISMIRPHIDRAQGTVTAQIAARNLESEAISYGPVCSLNTAGFIPVRANARFVRAKFNITGTFNNAQGFDIESTTSVGRN